MREFGVDEAGKGPVLGSMFAAAVVTDPAALPGDVGDSKDIAPERREELAAEIREIAGAVGVAEIPVERIDDDETDMNSLTVAAHVEALTAALADLDDLPRAPESDDPPRTAESEASTVDEADPLSGYVDAGDTNAVRFERRVAEGVTDRLSNAEGDLDAGVALDLRGEHGADETYPVVGAASIVAKVERDAHVERLATEYGEVGSGYPSDPTTKAFLESYVADHDALPPCARATWKTSRDALAAAAQSSLGEFEPDGGSTGEEADAKADGGHAEPKPTTLDDF
jgi:ribonuclease HII